MTLLLPNTIEPLTPADAVEVEQNYSVIEQYINNNVVNRNGSVAMTAPLTLYGQPSQDQHAATKAYVDSILPIGVIMPYGGTTAPAGRWALCNGASVSITTYPELHAVIGYRFGGSGGSFTLPDLKGRVIVGVDATQARFDVTGDKGGSWVMPVPKHHHVMSHNHGSFNSGSQSANHQHAITHNHGSQTTGDGGVHTHAGEFKEVAPGTFGDNGGYVAVRTSETGTVESPVAANSLAHKHTVDIAQFTGNSDSQNASHHHAIDVPNFVGDTGDTGTANAEHLPPYLVLNYIIRVS